VEGDQYVNISLVPLAVHHPCMELEACQVITDPETEADLSILIDKMLEGFNSRWRDACYYMTITTLGARNCQVCISTYHFWAMLLDPRTKKYIARVLPSEINRERLWKDVESACVEIVRIDFQHNSRSLSNLRIKGNEKNGAAIFFPEYDQEMENRNHRLPVEAIVADEIRKYQLDNGLKFGN